MLASIVADAGGINVANRNVHPFPLAEKPNFAAPV